MNAIQILVTCGLVLNGFAIAAPAYNGKVKGKVDDKPIDVNVVCERLDSGKAKLLTVRSDPGMDIDAKDRNGDGIAVSASGDLAQPMFAFSVLAGDRVYKFGGMRGELKLTPTGLAVKAHFKPTPKKPELTAYDVDLVIDCP